MASLPRPRESLPVIVLLTVVLVVALRGRPNGILLALAIGAVLTLLSVVAQLIDTTRVRMRRGYLAMLRDLASAEPNPDTIREAETLARTMLNARAGAYAGELDGMTSFVAAARGEGAVAAQCRAVLFAHAPWSRELERDIAAMRYRLGDDEYAGWLEWFLNARAPMPEFSDRIADVATYALPRIPQPRRGQLLRRTLARSTPRESWSHLSRVLAADIAALEDG